MVPNELYILVPMYEVGEVPLASDFFIIQNLVLKLIPAVRRHNLMLKYALVPSHLVYCSIQPIRLKVRDSDGGKHFRAICSVMAITVQ